MIATGYRAVAHEFSALPAEYMYLLGIYLGDGCISAHRRGVYKLRLFLDARYPAIVDACEAAIRTLLPVNKIARHARSGGFPNSAQGSNIEVSAYSRSWPCLIPQHGPGRKHERPIVLADWQRELLHAHTEALMRGLIHSDGCRFINTGRNWRHARSSFTNSSADIRGSSAKPATRSACTGPRRLRPSTCRASATSHGSTSSSARRHELP